MKVPFVNYPLQYRNLESEIDSALKKTLSEGQLILREDVEKFEADLAAFVGTKYAVGVNSGTDALLFSLKSAGIGQGDEVITVSHTFLASIAVVVHAGATPMLVDVKDDFLMDMDKVEEAITEKTRAILPVHLNGRVCDMEKLMAVARTYNLAVIEDSAQALGAKFNGKTSGSFGTAGCFSFYPAKLLGSIGDGGAVTTNEKSVADHVRLLRNHGLQTKTDARLFGFTSRLHNIQAAILNVKMPHVPEWIERRREIASIYGKGLTGVSGVRTPPAPSSDGPYFDVFQNYVLRAEKRDELFEYLMEREIETLVKDAVANHKHPNLRLDHFTLPYTEQLAKEVISLPMYPELTREQVEYVIGAVREFCEK